MEYLTVADYIVIVAFLAISTLIGLYQAFRGKRQTTANDYLLADRRMNPLAVIFSSVNVLSSVTYLGNPAEVYLHGPQYLMVLPSKSIGILLIATSFVPVYYNLRVTSIYEYLRMRFGKGVQYVGVAVNCVFLLMMLAMNVYAPALALNAITGLNIFGSIITVGLVCTLYTSLGGVKAVLWTGVFQTFIFLCGILVTLVACTIHVGGISEVFRINARDGRDIYFDFRPSPAIRHTFWSVFIGLGLMSASYNGTNQITVQRYLTCKSLRMAKLVSAFSLVFIGIVQVLTGITGLFLYAYFAGCDPLNAGHVQKADQIMAYIVIELFHDIPGLTGFLMSAIFSASLGNVSTGINSLTTMIGQDIIKGFIPNINDIKYTIIIKGIAMFVGVLIISLAFLVSAFGPILEASSTLTGILNGPLLGVFMLGIYFPRANSKGALVGMVSSVLVGSWLKTGALFHPPVLNDPPRFIDQCPNLLNTSTESSFEIIHYEFTTKQDIFASTAGNSALTDDISLYSLSYAYYTLLTTLVTIIFGLAVSFLTHPTNPSSLDPGLLSPLTRRLYHMRQKDSKTWKKRVVYHRANEGDIQLKDKV